MSKHGLRPPKQGLTPPGTGKMFKLPGAPGAPQATPLVREISEIDALKFKLAVQKDQNVAADHRAIENEQALLDQRKETLRLKTILIRQENMKDIGHLQIQAGDNVYEEGGKWYYKRANPLPATPMPAPPAPKEPPAEPPKDAAPPEGGNQPEKDGGEKKPGDEKA